MSNFKKLGNFFKFLVDVKTKKQAQALLHTLTPAQNLAIGEIITSPVDISIVIKGKSRFYKNDPR